MSAYHRYFNPDQVESDQKDIVISQLKAELFELRKSQKGYDSVFERVRIVEEEYYSTLQDLDCLKDDIDKEWQEGQREIR